MVGSTSPEDAYDASVGKGRGPVSAKLHHRTHEVVRRAAFDQRRQQIDILAEAVEFWHVAETSKAKRQAAKTKKEGS